ncbi:MAG: SDR family oxidoreductase, partial [Bacteroidales bacterium]
MTGKVVVITGASSGIGLACAQAFAARGAYVVMAARRADELAKQAAGLSAPAGRVVAIPCDVTQEEDCKRLIEETVSRFTRIDVLVNNAGISMRALFADLDLDVLRRLMDVNFWGAVYCTKYAMPYLLASKGSVVGVSSIAGFKGLPARTGYSASKFALYGFLDALRVENLKTGLHVMVMAPGFTASNIRKVALAADGSQQGETPRDESKMMQAEEVAEILVKGVERRKRDIILTT